MPNVDKAERIKRFQREFDANDTLTKSILTVLEKYRDKLRLRGDVADKDLDLAVSAMFVKAEKTFEAILELCCRGFGEDALTLLRSNINLMINFYYILAEDSVARASAFIAHGHCKQKKYVQNGGRAMPKDLEQLDWEKIQKLAAEWEKVSIKTKAEKAKQLYHYNVGYKFYSSIEHSDSWAISRYVETWDEKGPKLRGGPSDTLVDIALPHNFWVMSNIFLGFCSHFKIEQPSVMRELDDNWQALFGDSKSKESS
ncbi:MAG: hypothetical protein A2W73_04940 [Deltaproteobacteria bacterium RIFCSPLOWO2_12_55_13]|nr:MAG: hypothetical protein A2W73_04940 [Deltaproteobacteria bacterium RIFCSPLOWO2_12_55_13]